MQELGIRTANIDETSLTVELSEAVTGIYAGHIERREGWQRDVFVRALGWASVGVETTVYKMVMSIGWNPFYRNEKKTAEAWLLHEFPEVASHECMNFCKGHWFRISMESICVCLSLAICVPKLISQLWKISFLKSMPMQKRLSVT